MPVSEIRAVMKAIFIIVCLIAIRLQVIAQLNSGGFHARFGVDADTKTGYGKYGPVTGNVYSDDWFPNSPLSGMAVIDTSNADYYRSLLQSGNNISFTKRMPVPLYTNAGGAIWLDAVYGRDYIVNSSTNDSTTFTGGDKNGDDPGNWQGTVSPIPDKTDLVDVYGHMRRNGTSVHDSLWFFTGAATVGISGSRYFDIELYKNNISYNRTTGNFTSGGPNAGHTQWIFDAAGNITQTGDMIIAVSYSPGDVPVVEVRIWVSRTTFTTVTPSLFNFSNSFNGSTTSYGYASIESKSGATAFGSGIANYSATAAADTTWSTPWGSHNLAGGTQWSQQYTSLQLIEVGLNLTRIGLDPALYSSVLNSGACQSSFASIFFKSRSSISFTSNLQDFIGPLDFLQVPVLDHTLASPPLLSCANPTGYINVLNNTTAGYYTWTTADGSIIGSGGNSVAVNKGGMYIMKSSVAQDCPVIRTDTIIVPVDTFPPIASFYVTTTENMKHLLLHGGDTSASNYTTPFGGSQGLQWNWTGPQGFTSTVQSPQADTVFGEFKLVITENRNGCKDTASDLINFSVLSPMRVSLQATRSNSSVRLRWQTAASIDLAFFNIEKGINGGPFFTAASLPAEKLSPVAGYAFTDNSLVPGIHTYRIKLIQPGGQSFYSNISTVDIKGTDTRKFYLARNNYEGTVRAIISSDLPHTGKIIVYSTAGEIIYIRNVMLQKGQTQIDLPVSGTQKNKLQIVSLFIDNGLRFTQKAIF
jgi:hypothetical protein